MQYFILIPIALLFSGCMKWTGYISRESKSTLYIDYKGENIIIISDSLPSRSHRLFGERHLAVINNVNNESIFNYEYYKIKCDIIKVKSIEQADEMSFIFTDCDSTGLADCPWMIGTSSNINMEYVELIRTDEFGIVNLDKKQSKNLNLSDSLYFTDLFGYSQFGVPSNKFELGFEYHLKIYSKWYNYYSNMFPFRGKFEIEFIDDNNIEVIHILMNRADTIQFKDSFKPPKYQLSNLNTILKATRNECKVR